MDEDGDNGDYGAKSESKEEKTNGDTDEEKEIIEPDQPEKVTRKRELEGAQEEEDLPNKKV